MTAILTQFALAAGAVYLFVTGDAQSGMVCMVGATVIMALRPRL